MTTIRITFPWGRYHAHPWGLNPGRVREAEWPPSPWRLLRSLAAAWFRVHPGQEMGDDAKALLESLASEPPNIRFGKVGFTQTVHYQPNYGKAGEGNREQVARTRALAVYKNVRHENYFVAVSGPVYFQWPGLSLSTAQQELLQRLLGAVSYFGRADSICEAALADEILPEDVAGWAEPATLNGKPKQVIKADHRDVFCPIPSDFKAEDLWSLRSARPENGFAPTHLGDQLVKNELKADGGMLVSYRMPEGWPQRFIVRTAKRSRPGKRSPMEGERVIRYLRFDLQCRVPIHFRFIVPLAEQFRAMVSKRFRDRHPGEHSFALFGHKEHRPADLEGEHQHAFYLPMPHDRRPDAPIKELHIWCPMGFTKAESDVLQLVDRLNWGNGRYPIKPVLTCMSKEAPPQLKFSTGDQEAMVWRSITPFAPPRHFFRGRSSRPRPRPKDTAEAQLQECLTNAGLIASPAIHRLTWSGTDFEPLGSLPPQPAWDIARTPKDRVPDDSDLELWEVHGSGKEVERRVALYMQLEFDKPTALPLPAFGHSAHFGLGLFAPVR